MMCVIGLPMALSAPASCRPVPRIFQRHCRAPLLRKRANIDSIVRGTRFETDATRTENSEAAWLEQIIQNPIDGIDVEALEEQYGDLLRTVELENNLELLTAEDAILDVPDASGGTGNGHVYDTEEPAGEKVEKVENLGRNAGLLGFIEQRMPPELRAWVDELTGRWSMSKRVQGLILLNVMTVIMSTNWVVVKDAETMLDPFTFSAIRFVLAAAAFYPFHRKSNSGSISEDDMVWKAGVEVGVWSALGYLTQGMGLLLTDASRASFLSAFTVILVPILAGWSGRGVSKLTWGSAFVALLGTTLLEQGGGSPPSIGDVYNLMSAAFFALQIFRTEHYCRALPAGSNTKMLGTALGTTAVVSTALAVATHPMQSAELVSNLPTLLNPMTGPHLPWNELLYTSVFSTNVVLFIELVALHDVPSTDAAIIYTIEPVLGALLAYFCLGERWGPMGWAGAGLILMSSLITQLYGKGDAKDAEA